MQWSKVSIKGALPPLAKAELTFAEQAHTGIDDLGVETNTALVLDQSQRG